MHSGQRIRDAARALSHAGVTYDEICAGINPRHNWNSKALKQFASRSGNIRLNSKSIALIERLDSLDDKLKILDAETKAGLKSMSRRSHSEPILNERAVHGNDRIFQKARSGSSELDINSQLAFIRKGRSDDKAIVIRVDTLPSADGYSFTMKIFGDQNKRRIVTGNVLRTTMNTYFMGAAFMVKHNVTDDVLFDLDAFDKTEFKEAVSETIIGIETICVSNSQVANQVNAAFFSGLDGDGNPIAGIGIMITQDRFDDFQVDRGLFSSVSCVKLSKSLNNALNHFSSQTLAPSIADMNKQLL